jgi:adenylosuccinate synthase
VELLNDPILGEIAKLGNEFGTTTGRRRIVNYLNLDKLIHAVHLTGTTHLVINKGDILNRVKETTNLNPYRFIYGGQEAVCETLEEMQEELESLIECSLYDNDFQGIYFSNDPETVDWEA